MPRLIPLLLVALAPVLGAVAGAQEAPLDLHALAARAAVRYEHVPRKVLAFYYPWYGNPDGAGGAGGWVHWSGVDRARQKIASSTHWPALGPYDSHDPQVIRQHADWARRVGIDGWIVSWWGHGSYSDRAMGPILDACGRARLDVTAYYETVPGEKTPQSTARDIVKLLQKYGDHPAWLRVEGKPVVFIYGRAVGQLGLLGWAQVVDRVNRDYAPGAVLLGDRLSPATARVFDGIHTYNTAGLLRSKTPQQARAWAKDAYPTWVGMADRFGRISTLTVIPGYDDTEIRKPGLAVDRCDGALYEAQWQEAVAADPDWVLVTTFNEWHEGSEIEPSAQFGEKYLDLTAKWTAKFKALGPRTPRPRGQAPAGISPAEGRRQLARLGDLSIGLLPDGDLQPIWPLLARQPACRQLTWQQVADLTAADAGRIPLLLDTGGETYRRSATSPGDVDQGLARYLRSGGCLMVLPSGPMPFHYDRDGKTVGNAEKLGLPLSVSGPAGGWEDPPQGVKLTFHADHQALPHVPAEFPFPAAGDLRWRPLVRSRLAPGDVVVPLVELRDSDGNDYGLAAAYVEHHVTEPKGARIIYAWFGLLDMPQGEALLYDLYGFVGGRLRKP